ncbi:hypothetical protein LIER_13907 [Lithospermum erythrorhizon]|uniref:Uncharacterized protein n=1 Tax=Lithospermum erythrorhizon TaxID=34254 RepID=A0AAV3Q0B2_LITER
MSYNRVNLSSDDSDSQSYSIDTPANQELVDESQTATPVEIALLEEVTSACEAIHATKVGPHEEEKVEDPCKGSESPCFQRCCPKDKDANSKGKEKQSRVPKAWVPVEKTDRPKFPPADDTFAALKKLRKIFRHKLHWKIFCEEGVLIGADLIYDREFDLSGDPIPWGIQLTL